MIKKSSYGINFVIYKCVGKAEACDSAVKRILKAHPTDDYRDIINLWTDKEINGVKSCMGSQNPHLLKFYNIYEDEKYYYIHHEPIDGTLGDLMKLELSEEEIMDIGYKLAMSMKALRELNFIHHELRPEKIYFKNTKAGRMIKIGDLAVNDFVGFNFSVPFVVNYFPLEYDTFTEEKKEDERYDCYDIWAFGVIMHQLFFKEVIFFVENGKTNYI